MKNYIFYFTFFKKNNRRFSQKKIKTKQISKHNKIETESQIQRVGTSSCQRKKGQGKSEIGEGNYEA